MTEDWGTATWRYWQKIGNEEDVCPLFRNSPPVPVRARIEWETDGEGKVLLDSRCMVATG